ncbi:unnamed protein product [Oikopleura dioica]|uniref:Uncharacterized protein n=1 Tax=Oikopleura dioica TaxID=34765 RepID=E4XNF6_OIKDI|nr:unnamed protein product [Oikopleura dioica]
MKVTCLVFYFAGVLQASFATQNFNLVNEIIPVNDFEIAGNRLRNRRDYADIENSVGDFLDDVDFFLGKFEIIRNILKDVRYTYFILKQDILLIQDDIQNLPEKISAIDVTRIMDMCIKFIDDLILYFDVILQVLRRLLSSSLQEFCKPLMIQVQAFWTFCSIFLVTLAASKLKISPENLEKTEIALKHFISFLKREYADVEDRFENFIDKIESSEFFTNKFVIIRKIVNDLEDTYSTVKQDLLKIKDDIQGLSNVTAKDVTRIMGMCIKLIEDLIVNFEVLLEDWLDLLEPLIIFDKNIIMGPLKLILQLTTVLSTSATFIEIFAKILEAMNDPDTNISEIIRNFFEHLGISGRSLE